MKHLAACLSVALFATGCTNVTMEETKSEKKAESGATSPPSTTADSKATTETTPAATTGTETTAGAAKTTQTPVPIEDGVITLSPENTRIEFIGTHNKPDPDPRYGTFEKFSGKAEVDAAAKAVKSITVDIDTTTVKTVIDKLTNHLNQPDFFDTREYPTAKFESTEITPGGGEGQFVVKGNLTLHGVTKELSFPAVTTFSDDGVISTSTFQIDRREFGMDQNLDGVNPDISMTVVIGEKNVVPVPPAPAGG